ncbi:hypothetical protein [Nocardiopsis sp. NPDC006938]|uniref:hypothetical protein n=1 Tax=Nocardiopsis sp. NPDC006938 TaxID=3364337 RepID=UPI00368A876C
MSIDWHNPTDPKHDPHRREYTPLDRLADTIGDAMEGRAPEPEPEPVESGRGRENTGPSTTPTSDRDERTWDGEPDTDEVSEDTGGGYASTAGDATYATDIAMMRSEADYTRGTVIPHVELLISQAELAGNGPKTMTALRAALEAARTALGASEDAIAQVSGTNEPVQAAYDDAAQEAATDPAYFNGD